MPPDSFSEIYIERCFFAWMTAGCPIRATHIHEIVPLNEDGIKPQPSTLKTWITRYGWKERAAVLNTSAIAKAEEQLIEEKSKFFAKEFEVAIELQTKGLDFIRDRTFDSSASAVQAIRVGSDLAFRSAVGGSFIGLPDNVEDLKKRIVDLLERAQENDQIIDVDNLSVKSDTVSELEIDEPEEKEDE